MKNLNSFNEWTLTEEDIDRTCQEDNFNMLEANRFALKREEQEFAAEIEELQHQFRDILAIAGINKSQFPITPKKNITLSYPSTPTFMLTPKDLDIQKCFLINSLNDSASLGDRLNSDGCSDDEHSPMSTDTEMSDDEDETVFMDRLVEGCEESHDDSLQFSTSFIAGHENNKRKNSSNSTKGQGSNPLASSTMMEDIDEPVVVKKSKPVRRGVSIPKASSTILYNPYPERPINRSFSPVVKIEKIQDKRESNNANIESIFTWSLQNSSEVPLEESYLRSVKKRQISKSTKASRPRLQPNTTVNGMSVIGERGKTNEVVTDSLCIENPLYNQTKTIPRSSTKSNVQKVNGPERTNNQQNNNRQRSSSDDAIFKRPSLTVKTTKDGVERKNSVVKKLLRFRESFKKKSGTSDLKTLATV